MRQGWLLLLLCGMLGAGALAQDDAGSAVAVAQVEAASTSQEVSTGRRDLRQQFRRGLRSVDIELGYLQQHNMPSGPRSRLDGPLLSVTHWRFSDSRVQKGLSLSLADVSHNGYGTDMWSLSLARRQYFRVRSDYGAFWTIGAGLTHLTETIPELGSHTNFNQFAGVGIVRTIGRRDAVMAEYRFTHISNGGRTDPNVGLNCSTWLLGWTTFF